MVPFCIPGLEQFQTVFNVLQMVEEKRPLDQHPHGALMASAPQKTFVISQIIAVENPRSLRSFESLLGKASLLSHSAHEPILVFSFFLHTTTKCTGEGQRYCKHTDPQMTNISSVI